MTASSFDYIVVGAGTAGCLLANRLSADPGTSVLVVVRRMGRPDRALERADSLTARGSHFVRGCGIAPISRAVQRVGGRLLR